MKSLVIVCTLLFFNITINSQTVLFSENFDNPSLFGWTILDDQPAFSGPSKWYVENKELRQTSNIWAYAEPLEFFYHLGTQIIADSTSLNNYTINALIKSTDNDGIGIIFRYVNQKNYYRLLLLDDAANGGPKRKLQKFVNGEPITLYEKTYSDATPTGWFSVTADVRGDTITTYVDGERFASALDSTYSQGKIGLFCYANSGAYFDSIKVTDEFVLYGKPNIPDVVVERAPYIQLTEKTSVSIAWNSSIKTKGRVTVTGPAGFTATETELVSDVRHIVTFNNLLPNTTYNYKVFNDATLSYDSLSFKTMPEDTANHFSFLIWGDSGTKNSDQFAIASHINSQSDSVDFAIHVGDVSQFSGEEYDEIFFKPYKKFVGHRNVFTAIGNHDTYHDNATTYLKDFYYSLDSSKSERYYTFKWGNTFFINLDSNIDYKPNSPQYNFLISALNSEERANSFWTVVYFHHPPYCELWTGYPGEIPVRTHLVPLFEKYKVDFVFNGHTHGYERGMLNGVTYIITGGGGGGLDDYARDFGHITKSSAVHHYSKMTINGNSISFKAVDRTGSSVDAFSLSKSPIKVESEATTDTHSGTHLSAFINQERSSLTVVIKTNVESNYSLKLFNTVGELIDVLAEGYGSDLRLEKPLSNIASGIYIVHLERENEVKSIKIAVVK